jgi:hypothetical protein
MEIYQKNSRIQSEIEEGIERLRTEFIAHRINTIAELMQLPTGVGVELDIRDQGDDLILVHDPFQTGEKFEPFLEKYVGRRTLILNVKSERIEHRVLDLIKKYGISDYFFLDSSFPMIVQLAKLGERKIAVRFSEFESLETVKSLAGQIDWIWVDCFSKLPIDKSIFDEFKDLGFKLCLVSPELQGRPQEIEIYRDFLKKEEIVFDAICTKIKNFSLWIS